MEPDTKASHLLLHMADVARKVRLAIGKAAVGNLDGVEQVLNISRRRFAPNKVDCIFQDITKFLNFKRATQDMDTYLLEFDMLRQRAEARFAMGAGFPDEFASALCMQNASLSLSKNERQLAIASVGSSLTFVHVSAQMRRLCGNIDSSQNMDALVAQDLDNVSDDENFEAWAAYG